MIKKFNGTLANEITNIIRLYKLKDVENIH